MPPRAFILPVVPVLGDMFERFESRIRRLPRIVSDDDLLRDTFLLHREGSLEIYYSPSDWLRPGARLAIVGITPGRDTMRIAYQTVVDGLRAGKSVDRVLDDVKLAAAFGGFRTQLNVWLTQLGIYRGLGLDDADDPWLEGAPLIQPTSAVRYPVFVAGRNYSGRNPDLVKSPVLREYLFEVLAPELEQIPESLIVPLGDKVSEALHLLGAEGRLDLDRCLIGFPHPSGNNGHRMRKWAENRNSLERKAKRWFASHPSGSREAHVTETNHEKPLDLLELQDRLRAFASEREWDRFHTPKNLAMALVGEGGELLEIFQWLTDGEAAALGETDRKRVAQELADIQIYLVRLADVLGIALSEAVATKLVENAERYPVETSRGNATKRPRPMEA
jgi:NTP pyrophosphatase (non-canonical NTP hydrolase)